MFICEMGLQRSQSAGHMWALLVTSLWAPGSDISPLVSDSVHLHFLLSLKLYLGYGEGPLPSVGQLESNGEFLAPTLSIPYSLSLLASRLTWPLSPQLLYP